jgi:hypothetical protein
VTAAFGRFTAIWAVNRPNALGQLEVTRLERWLMSTSNRGAHPPSRIDVARAGNLCVRQ